MVPGPSGVFAAAATHLRAAATHLRIPAPASSGWDFLRWTGLPAVPAAGRRRDFPSGLPVEDGGRDFRRGAEAGRGLPAPEVWGIGLPGLGAASRRTRGPVRPRPSRAPRGWEDTGGSSLPEWQCAAVGSEAA